ncbi:helix-turn-helix domain-containing protein [Streptomyces flavofungini]|uniref:helix-turn-helix domain-containing protein n=1 Tax=Streptomyces flavofungini TaxID=68200 RepID=UPI0025B120A1|nr:helix-turn-helix transcriptional regulator [Streptomyces flavofungini]WJV48806.1 helix-turn-helix transcriptional regulator [Streptomyces flavofungini]
MAKGAHGSRQAAWEFFGAELKRRREEAAFTQVELGARVFVSGGYIGQFEQAIRKPQLDVAQRIDETLRTDGLFERMWRKLIKDQPFEAYFAHVAELERLATKICEFEPMLVPGLLQTPEYTRALYEASHPFAEPEYIEEQIQARMDRAHILKDATRPEYWVILHEAALRVPVGDPATMASQLDRLREMVSEHKVLIQVIPFVAGAHTRMGKTMRLMEFEDAPPAVYTEGVHWGNLLDEPAVVKRVQGSYDLLRAAALPPEASLILLKSAAEDHRRCVKPT